MDLGNEKVVWLLTRSVSSEDQSVDGIVLPHRSEIGVMRVVKVEMRKSTFL